MHRYPNLDEIALQSPEMTDEQSEWLKASIQEVGQLLPIILFKGRVIDGRHRLRA